MAIKLVDNWKNGAKMISAWALLIVAATEGAWAALTEAQQAAVTAIIPEPAIHITVGVIAVIGFVGRFIKQGLGSD